MTRAILIEIIVKPSEDLEVKSLALHNKTHEKNYSARQIDDKGYYFLLEPAESEQSISIEIIIELTSGQTVTFQAKPIELQAPQNMASTNNSNNNNDTGNFDSNNSANLDDTSSSTTISSNSLNSPNSSSSTSSGSLNSSTSSSNTHKSSSSSSTSITKQSLTPSITKNQSDTSLAKHSKKTETASSNQETKVRTIYRLYNAALQVHLYTKDANEYQILAQRGWQQEGQAWQFTGNQGQAVYRLYQPHLKVHLYTQDKNEYKMLAQKGWRQEGEAFRSFGQLPIYRLYNENLRRHLYTKDIHEYQILAKRGWRQEGVAFYGLGKPTSSISPTNLRKGKLVFSQQASDTVQVQISDIRSANPIKSVMLAVWSDEKGQDDLIWYKAKTQADGTYSVVVSANQHRFSTGNYQAHLYYQETNEQLVGVNKGTFRLQLQNPKGKLNVSNVNQQAGTFDILVSNVQSSIPVQSISIAIWTDQGGQDDLRWYSATKLSDGRYKITVKAKYHKQESGLYHIHLYYTLNNQQTYGISTSNYNLTLSPPQITSRDAGKNLQSITISRVDSRFSSVQVAVWTDHNGQDDKMIYSAHKQTDGNYHLLLPLKNHSFETGTYHIQLLGKLMDEIYPIASHKLSISTLAPLEETIVNVLANQTHLGQLDLAIKETDNSKNIRQIRAVSWSDTDRTNLYWYQVIPTGKITNIKVDVRYHYYRTATYFLHVYIDYTDGTTKGYDLGKHYLNSPIKNPINTVLTHAFSLVGVTQWSPQHLQLVADYNSVLPLPVGYQVKAADDWCDIFITVLFQRLDMSHLIGRECGVERHIQIFKSLGIWIEDGRITPRPGDIITFNWDQNSQENDGFADHIGIVERVENGYIYTIEGNGNRVVTRRSYPIGQGNIRGFARPRY